MTEEYNAEEAKKLGAGYIYLGRKPRPWWDKLLLPVFIIVVPPMLLFSIAGTIIMGLIADSDKE